MVKNTNTFVINHVSEDDGESFEGTFTSKRQSIMDMSRIKVRKAQLNGGMYCVMSPEGAPTGQGIDYGTEILNHMIATLETVLVQKPEWWDINKISDFDLISKVFREVMTFENSFRRRTGEGVQEGQSASSGKEGSKQESTATDTSDLPKKVVGKEVQAALDA